MYEDLEDVARLKFGKRAEAIAAETVQKIQEANGEFARTSGAVVRSGQHEARLAELRISGIEETARAFSEIWVDLIQARKGIIEREDAEFISKKIQQFVDGQTVNLNKVFERESRGVISYVTQRASMRLYGVAGSLRRDLEIMARESELFPNKSEELKSMKEIRRKRFSVGRRVLVGMGLRPGTVQSVADAPSTLGEFVHAVLIDGEPQARRVLGSEIHPIPELDEDLRPGRTAVHIHNSNVANLNLGSQVGTITANLQAISNADGGRQFAEAMESFANAVVAEQILRDDVKKEVLDAATVISEQAVKKPEERSSATLKALTAWIPTAISAANGLVTLWDKVGPIIKSHLGI